jgi:hypothetical protein
MKSPACARIACNAFPCVISHVELVDASAPDVMLRSESEATTIVGLGIKVDLFEYLLIDETLVLVSNSLRYRVLIVYLFSGLGIVVCY